MSAAELGRRLRAARAYAGLSRQALCASIGTTPDGLRRIERGQRTLSPDELRDIASVCGVRPEFLVGGTASAHDSEATSSDDIRTRLRALRESLDGLLARVALDATPRPVRDEASKRLDALDPLYEAVDPRVIRAIEHPLRKRLLGLCMDRARTAADLSEKARASVDDVLEQLDVLVASEAVERVVRDGEAAYQAIVWDMFDDRQWSYFPPACRRDLFAYILDLIQGDVRVAMPSGGFDGDTVHVSRNLLRLDERGYAEATELLKDLLVRVLQISAESDARRTYGETQAEIETEVAIMHFDRQPLPGPPAAVGPG